MPPQTDKIQDDGQVGKYFHYMLNMADDDLNPYQYRLLGHYRRVCGLSGSCWEATRTTAEKTQMSVGKVSETRQELAKAGYISIEKDERGGSCLIRVLDLMKENVERYTVRSQDEQTVHHMNTMRSPHETKNQPQDKNQLSSPSGAQRENSEEADNVTSNHLSVDTPLAEPVSEPKTRKQKNTVAAAPKGDTPRKRTNQWVVKVNRGNVTCYLSANTTGNNPPDAKCLGYSLNPLEAIVYAEWKDAVDASGVVFEATGYRAEETPLPKNRGLPPTAIWDAMQVATYGRAGLGSGGVVTKLAWAAIDTYGDVRYADMTDEATHLRCCNAIATFAKEWQGKELDTIVNEDTYKHHFTLFLQRHPLTRATQTLTPRAVTTTAAPPRFKLPSESFVQKVSEESDNA